jgi:hypothetical protein
VVCATAPSFEFGQASDQRVVGDWDGDGTTTAGVKRRSVGFATVYESI